MNRTVKGGEREFSEKIMRLATGEPTTERINNSRQRLDYIDEGSDCGELMDVSASNKVLASTDNLQVVEASPLEEKQSLSEQQENKRESTGVSTANDHKRAEDADDEVENELDSNDTDSRDRNNRRRRAKHKKKESPFEKLNTLKLLYDCGHLTEEEYKERKNQIINDMTGTSADVSRRRVKSRLQPIMRTVVPHKPPDFSTILAENAERLCFDVDTLEWHSSKTTVKLDLVPFATGQLRNAYFLLDLGENGENQEGGGKLLVSKLSIHPTDPSTYLSDVEMQAVCAHYAKLYNEHNPPLKVHYARSWLLKLQERDDMVCSLEEYIPGIYVKYSNNNGFVGTETSTTEERERNTPQAFSHFTFVASEYKLMVVDIQGVNDHYTDPQIHTADGQGFGTGNLGTYGMEKFLQSHRCNEVCRWLGLKSLNKQFKPGGTAAPNYQMPYRDIKKSSRRITEERNTYSRSVAVSEMLGNTLGNSEYTRLLPPQDHCRIERRNSVASCICRCLTCCFTG